MDVGTLVLHLAQGAVSIHLKKSFMVRPADWNTKFEIPTHKDSIFLSVTLRTVNERCGYANKVELPAFLEMDKLVDHLAGLGWEATAPVGVL